MAPLISEAYYVAETQGLRDLLLEMRRDDAELVVIVDE
jgi:CBS domain containing-hemolysin-like protein